MRGIALLALGLAGLLSMPGCSSGADAELPKAGNPIKAPRQAGTQLLIWRGIAGNPPVFDLVAASSDRSELTVVAGMSAGEQIRPRLFDEPAWSPDGTTIAFTADLSEPYGQGGFPKTDIYLMRADGTDLRRVTSDGLSTSPIWSPDGQTIIYARRTKMEEPRTLEDLKQMSVTLWTMTGEGQEQRPVFEPVDGRIDAPAGWSPDGSRFLFTRGTFALPGEGGRIANTTAIYVVNADGSGLTKLAERSVDPAWSPDGRQIVFASDRDENGELGYGDAVSFANELYVMEADGSNQRRLTKTRDLNEESPAWSPDETLIAYQRGEVVGNAQGTGVFVMKNDGACPTPVAFDEKLDIWYASPAWHPGAVSTSVGELECDAPSGEEPLDEATVRWAMRANAACEPWQARRAEATVELDEERLAQDFSYVWRVMPPIEAGIVRDLEAIADAPARVQEALSLYRARLALLDRALKEWDKGLQELAMEMFDRLERDKLPLGAALGEIRADACSPP